MQSMTTASLSLGRRRIDISHPDKLLFAAPDVSKLDLAEYYARVGAAMLPHLRDRPLALQAFPAGIGAPGYFMKSAPAHFPPWIATVTVDKRGGTLTQVIARDTASLVYLAAQNVITPHIWLSRADQPRLPDRLILDLDPSPGVSFGEVRAAARSAGDRLRDAGLAPYAMVTGSRGIHIVCPLRRHYDFTTVHGFARRLAETMVADDPRHLTLQWHREDRGARIYIDVNRINYAQHVIAPYSVRPRPGAPVAMPVEWDELEDATLTPDRWTIADAPDRLAARGDAWRGIGRHARCLPEGSC
jgi:bifunctional non-homologous end joining protein LigD